MLRRVRPVQTFLMDRNVFHFLYISVVYFRFFMAPLHSMHSLTQFFEAHGMYDVTAGAALLDMVQTLNASEFIGESANAVPDYQKLCVRVTHVWGNRRGQPSRSAMERPHPRETAFMITVYPHAR